MPFVFEKGNKLVLMEMLPTSFTNTAFGKVSRGHEQRLT